MNRMTEPAARPGTAQFCALLAATASAPCAAADGLPAAALDTPSPVLPLAILALLLVLLAGALGWLARRYLRLRDELHATREQARHLADMLDVWHWQTDAEHRLRSLRPPQGAAMSQWSPPPTALLWEQFPSADADALRACLAARAPIADLAATLESPQAGALACRLRGAALHDAQGRFQGYVGTARIVAADVAVATAPPSDAARRDDTAAPPSERESFAYTVSHDLRAPIRVVEGFTKILKEDYGRLLDRIGNDHLDRILGAASRMNSMIDALLALSQLSTQPLARQPVNLSQLAGFVADDLQRESPQRRVQVTIEPGLQVQGDPTLLRVMLENLLGNAWKYTARAGEPQIRFGRERTPRGEVFVVSDNGAGFDMRFADRLFGVFQRLHSAGDFKGTGVGLASVRRIVRRHGGDIWAEAEVERGASFYFTLEGVES